MSDKELKDKELAEEKKGEGVEVEIKDDTPVRDQRRKPLDHEAELAVAPEEKVQQEIEQYDDKVKRRIKDLRHAYHDERRAKESAFREREEAIQLVKKAFGEVESIRSNQAQERQDFLKHLQERAKEELELARSAYKQAHNTGDADQVLAAQEALGKAQINSEVLSRGLPPASMTQQAPLQRPQDVVQSQQYVQSQSQQQPVHDPQAEDWAEENPWFGENKVMTATAYGLHEELVSKGVNPTKDASKYYSHINKTMREKFPEYDWDESESSEKEVTRSKPDKQEKEVRTATVVAPVQRTTRGTKVTLTTSQVSLARRLGLTPEQYAVELVKTFGGQNG